MATSGHEGSRNGRADDGVMIVTVDALTRLLVPLTVVHGHLQLVRRRIQRNQIVVDDELEEALARIEGATRSMVDAMAEILRTPSRPTGGPDAG